MKKILASCLFLFCVFCSHAQSLLPSFVKGDFVDDYGIKYSISDTLWKQLPRAQYHILESNAKDQYLIARNGAGNSSEPGLFTRIDYMPFSNMGAFEWGFCYTVYKAVSDSEARNAKPADRENPRKGCNGFPFSRMKREVQ